MPLTINWYDMMSNEEDRLLALSLEDWTAVRVTLMKTRPAFATRIDHLRRDLWYARKDRRTVTPDVPQMRYYRDIADEPWKYGDDAFEQWLLLDNDLPKYPGRWRVDAYWTLREEESRTQTEFEAKMDAATKIQALVRGHQQRTRTDWMDCSECLGHGVAPYEVEGRNVCRSCYDTLGWSECAHCGMPVHHDRLADFSGCCSLECMSEVMEVEDLPLAFCDGCGVGMDPEDHNEYRPGFWCSRACAYA
jgi:hypothetical protein